MLNVQIKIKGKYSNLLCESMFYTTEQRMYGNISSTEIYLVEV